MKKIMYSLILLFAALPAFAQVRPTVDFKTREVSAPAAVKTRLQQIRTNIQSKKLPYTVGYTEVFDLDYKQITGDIQEKVKPEDAVRQNILAQNRLKENGMSFQKSILELTGYQPSEILYNTYSKFDWREKGIMTPVKAQSSCGSCWAFGSIGSYEACYKMLNAVETDMSEQQLLDCGMAWSKPVGTCSGGTLGGSYEHLVKNGASKEAALAYKAAQVVCSNPAITYKPVTWGWILTDYTKYNVQVIKDALIKYGPLGVRMLIPKTSAINSYNGGIWKETEPVADDASSLGHFVVLVGWDDSKKAWLIKNSWGNSWGIENEYSPGERGYCWIDYNSNMICNNTGYIVPEQIALSQFRCTAVFEKSTAGEVQVYDYTYINFKKRYDELWAKGMRLKILKNRIVNGEVVYTAAWKQSTEGEVQAYAWGYDDFKKKYDELWSQGWRLDILNNFVAGGKVLYTAVWHKSTEGEVQVYGWSYDDFRKKYDEIWKDGWRIHVLTNYVLNNKVYYSAVWRKTSQGEFQVYSDDYDSYRKKYDELWGKGYRLHTLNNYVVDGKLLYTAVFKPSAANEKQLYNWTYVDYRNKYDMYWKLGWRLKMLNAW